MKGVINPDHIPVNKWQLIVVGLPPLTITEQSGIEDELETTELPDRTIASGGNRKSAEFTIMIPTHHTVGNITRTRSLVGVFVSKRTDPDLEMKNEGEMASTEYTIKVDDVLPA